MPENPQYGKELKKIVFEETDHQHAKFIIRLRHNSITQSDFFRAVIDGFIESDERICSFVEDYAKERKLMNKQRIKKSRMLKNFGHQKIQDFGFSKNEIDEIYDTIGEEGGEL